jgi:hypothetical protein
MHKSMVLFIALIVLPAVGVGLLIFNSTGARPTAFALPSEGQIQKMTATFNDLSRSLGISPVPAFEVPRERYGVILSAMSPPKRYEYPAQWEWWTVGQVDVDTRDGKRLTIKFCDCGKNPL